MTKMTTTTIKPRTATTALLGVILLLVARSDPVAGFATSTTSTAHRPTALRASNGDDDAARKLLDKAAALRAEIAAMEGKTVAEVEKEALLKKEGERSRREEQEAQNAARMAERTARSSSVDDGRFLQLPSTTDDMVRQAARAVERAFKDGRTRQTVRFNQVAEGQAACEENEWPGGARQIYRESVGPLATELLGEVRAPTKEDHDGAHQRSLPPDLSAEDVWDFDGSALHTAEAREGPSADVRALVMANTDTKYLKDIQELSDASGPRLFLLVNPFWRNLDSWSFNLLAPGAKQKAQAVVFDEPGGGYEETYHLLVFQARGEKCAAVKAYPYDWQLFAFREDDYYPNQETVVRLGSCAEEPTSALVTELLNERPEFKQTKTMRQMKNLF